MEQLKPYNIYSYRELCNSIGEEPVKGGNKRVAQEKRIAELEAKLNSQSEDNEEK